MSHDTHRDDERRPTAMVRAAVARIFEGSAGADRIDEVARLIDATAATSFAKGVRACAARVRDGFDAVEIADALVAVANTLDATNVRSGYPGQVSALDYTGKILLFQVDASRAEMAQFAEQLQLVTGCIVVALPADSVLTTLDDDALKRAGFVLAPFIARTGDVER